MGIYSVTSLVFTILHSLPLAHLCPTLAEKCGKNRAIFRQILSPFPESLPIPTMISIMVARQSLLIKKFPDLCLGY
jgi:hypothetical protein